MSTRSLLPEYHSVSPSGASNVISSGGSREWLQAIRMPANFRIGNTAFRCQTTFTMTIMFIGVITLILFYTILPKDVLFFSDHMRLRSLLEESPYYNSTYPLTKPVVFGHNVKYRIAVVADMDKASKLVENTWISKLKLGWLVVNQKYNQYKIEWDKDEIKLKGSLAQNGRGMELSELIVFNGKLLAFDDRTGIVYQVEGDKVLPWVFLPDGDGRTLKGFKSEWAAVKDGLLYVGGLGKEWTTSKGDILSYDPQWIKLVTPGGRVIHRNWRDNFIKLCAAANIEFPGYMIHEAVSWSPVHQEWFFLPRKASHEQYDDTKDELRGTNLLLRSSSDFKRITLQKIGPKINSHGFSSFKFIPESRDSVAVAIKSEEIGGRVATYVTVFNVADGRILLPESKIGNVKYEGIEFV